MLAAPPRYSTTDRFGAILLLFVLALTALAVLMTVVIAIRSRSSSEGTAGDARPVLRDGGVLRRIDTAKRTSISTSVAASTSAAATTHPSPPVKDPSRSPADASPSSVLALPAPTPAEPSAGPSTDPPARAQSPIAAPLRLTVELCTAGAAANTALDRWVRAGLPAQRACGPDVLKVDATGSYYCVGGYSRCAAPPLAICDRVAACLHEIGHLIGLGHPGLADGESCTGAALREGAWTMAMTYQNPTVIDGLNCAGQDQGPWPANLAAALGWLTGSYESASFYRLADAPAKAVVATEAAPMPSAAPAGSRT
ncbi:MAG: hypothetical protein EXR43_02470 [Dehalococcoidia bacterium]|nr:hypothetical protein [Dehalococcoidia bacterium]